MHILEAHSNLSPSVIFWLSRWYEPLLLLALLWVLFKIKLQQYKPALWIMLYGLISVIIFSPSIGRGLEGFRFTLLFVAMLLIGAVLNYRKILQKIYLLSAFLMATWGLIEYFLLPSKYWSRWGIISASDYFGLGWHLASSNIRQAASFIGGPNQLASYLLSAIFIVLFLFINTYKKNKKLSAVYLLCDLIMFLTLLLTGSRSALVGVISGILLTGFIVLKPRYRKKYLLALLIGAIFAGLIISQNTAFFKQDIFTHKKSQDGHVASLKLSLEEIAYRAKDAKMELIFGSGLGTSGPIVIKYGDGIISESWYLQVLFELGIVGLSLWLFMILSLLKELWEKSEHGLFVALVAVSVTATFLHTWADGPATSYTLFLLLGSALGLKNSSTTLK